MYREDGIKLQRYKTQNQLPVQIFVLIRSIAQLYARVSTIEVAPPHHPFFYEHDFWLRPWAQHKKYLCQKKILKLILCSYPW